MTPYRLVTVGQDGLARMWDIREAALKRCKTVRTRSDYILPKIASKVVNREENADVTLDESSLENGPSIQNEIELPPLPVRASNNVTGVGNSTNRNAPIVVNANRAEDGNNIYVPPLPAGAENGVGAQDEPNGNGRQGPGAFVANDEIDEGVSLLSKLQHGVTSSNDQMGSQTRSSRKKVNVYCIDRCPIGGHFATGSDDGVGRIWADDDDNTLQSLDTKLREPNSRFDGKGRTDLLQSHKRDPRTRSNNASKFLNFFFHKTPSISLFQNTHYLSSPYMNRSIHR